MRISLEEVRKVAQLYQTERVNRAAVTHYEPETVPPVIAEFSDDTQLVRDVMNEVDRMPSVRADRVQAIKAKLTAGEYEVSSKAIADSIMRRVIADRLR